MRRARLIRLPLKNSMLAIAIVSTLFFSSTSNAFEFALNDGDIKGSFDTTVSYGALIRGSGQDPSNVGTANHGTSRSVNEDNGNLNYGQGDVVSSLFKVTHDLDLSYKNFGFFGRVLYFYDDAIAHKDNLPAQTSKLLKDDVSLLDFYVRGQFDVAGRDLNARIGNQVVNWGESTFIPNGINVINPVDLSRLRAPGSELKEGLLPQQMLWLSRGLTDNINLEGFYQFKFEKTRIEPNGSFFSTNDIASPGANRAYVGFGLTPDQNSATGAGRKIDRGPDESPSDSGQFGLSAHWLLPALNNTELGFYAMQYHSRTPMVSSLFGGNAVVAGNLPSPTNIGYGTSTDAQNTLSRARYFVEYPEDIRLYGLSATGSAPWGIALQGEYSYRPNQPVQIAPTEFVLATLGQSPATQMSGIDPRTALAGQRFEGYQRIEMQQIQVTGTKSFGPQWGSSQVLSILEAGFTYLNLPDQVKFAGSGTSLPAIAVTSSTGKPINLANGNTQPEGWATRSSYGYRLVTRADYPNAIGSITLTPRVAWSHDLRGVSPTFNQGTKAISIGLTGSYRQNLQGDISYNAFFGGRSYSGINPVTGNFYSTTSNPLKDRDFIAATVSYSF